MTTPDEPTKASKSEKRHLYAKLLGMAPKGKSGKDLLMLIKSKDNSADLLKLAGVAIKKLNAQETSQERVDRVLEEIVKESSDEVEETDEDKEKSDADKEKATA